MLRNLTIKARLVFVIGFLSALLVAIGVMGLRGMGAANEGLETVFNDRLIPSQQIARINDLMQDNIVQLQTAAQFDPRLAGERRFDYPLTRHTAQVRQNIETITGIWQEYMATYLTEEESRLAELYGERRGRFVREGLLPAAQLYESGAFDAANALMATVTLPAYAEAKPVAEQLLKLQLDVADSEFRQAVAAYVSTRNLAVGAIALGVLLSSFLGWLLVRAIVGPLTRTIGYFREIAGGNLANTIEIRQNDEVGAVLHELEGMQGKLKTDIEQARIVANENLRIRNALDRASTCVMVADAGYNIIYMNSAVQQMFRQTQDNIRKMLPGFDAEKVLGSSIDIFHRNPAHQRQLLTALKASHKATIEIGGSIFDIVANPIVNDAGERIGSVMEWNDRTAVVTVERAVADLVEAAAQGDFTQRIDTARQEGFFLRLGDGINELMATTETSLNEVVRVLGRLAEGDLTERVTGDFQGTFGRLKDDTNTTVDQMKQLIGQIKEAVDAINTAAKEIAAGNTNLSQRTEEQASSLEETASSMEELTSTVRQNADNARQANQLAHGASDVASKGGDKVHEVVATMNAITDSSRKIADIITVIDGIAFQTNILALNAAVEAARAGEQGRGFAVVAGEVRTLAQRSASAAKEIKELITNSTDTVESGSKLVEEAGATMEEIVTAVKRVTDIMAEISAASDEQSQGIEQVNSAIGQMDEVTQQNAALVEEAAASAESLEEQAQGLARAVSVFRLDSGRTAQPARTRAAPSRAAPARTPRADTGRTRPATKAPTAKAATAEKKAGCPVIVSGDAADEWEEF